MKSLLVIIALAGMAAADTHTNKATQLSFDAPKTYKLTEQDLAIKGESGDKAVALAFWVVELGDAEKAEHDVATQFYTMIGSLQWDKPRTGKVGGLPASFVDGTGRTAGKKLDLHMAVVGPTATKKYAILVGIVDQAQAAAHQAEIATILKSLRPAK